MNKKKEKIKVNFVGANSDQVTGSCIHIEMQEKQILLECGLMQGGKTILEDYKNAVKKFDFNPSKINYVFVCHAHIDHTGLLPRLIKEGFCGKIIVPKGNKKIIYELCKDCAFIMFKDCEALKKKFKDRIFIPAYNEQHVSQMMDYIVEYDMDENFELDENVSFSFCDSQHIICSAQLSLWLNQNNHIKKIIYTSDLGNVAIKNNFVNNIQKLSKANLLIGEATYCEVSKKLLQKHREKDLEKIQCVINQCSENRTSCLIPTFSLHRTQEMITEIYKLYKDSNIKIDFIIASPLANKICDIFLDILTGEELELFKEVMSWEKLKRIRDYDKVIDMLEDKNPHVWLASSGFMTAGYSRSICAYLLGNSKNTIILSGYAPEGSLAYKIKNGTTKTITIDNKVCKNLASAIVLKSFSSHMQYYDLLKYYSDFNVEKICIVHADKKQKLEFCKVLQEEIYKKNKTQRVVCVTNGTSIKL